jgi:thioredoxin 1
MDHQTEKITGGGSLRTRLNIQMMAILIGTALAFLVITGCSDRAGEKSKTDATSKVSQSDTGSQQAAKLPLLVDLGKGTCIPCKKMKPILDELTIEYQGKAIVKVIDLRYEPRAARQYKIRLIPTQIFYDADSNEIYRHEGFMDKQSIKAKFAEMGVR